MLCAGRPKRMISGCPKVCVAAKESYAAYLGCGCNHYGDTQFPVLQCPWPDKNRTFPGDSGSAAFLATDQPLPRESSGTTSVVRLRQPPSDPDPTGRCYRPRLGPEVHVMFVGVTMVIVVFEIVVAT